MPRLLLLLAVLAVSTAAPFIRYAAPAPALTVAAARVCLAALLLSFVSPRAWRLFLALPRREKVFLGAAGLLLGAHFGVWISSLYFTSTAASVALVATQPMFAALLARLVGDSITSREIAGIAVATLGCMVLGGGDLLRSPDHSALIGDGLALAGAATAAGYLLVGRRMRVSLPLTPYLALVNTIAGASLAVAALVAGTRFVGFPAHVYLAFVLVAVIPSLIGHSLLNWSVRRTPAHLVTLAILGEPVGASLLTWAFFAEVPPTHTVLGGAIILFGILYGFLGWSSPASQKPVVTETRGERGP